MNNEYCSRPQGRNWRSQFRPRPVFQRKRGESSETEEKKFQRADACAAAARKLAVFCRLHRRKPALYALRTGHSADHPRERRFPDRAGPGEVRGGAAYRRSARRRGVSAAEPLGPGGFYGGTRASLGRHALLREYLQLQTNITVMTECWN